MGQIIQHKLFKLIWWEGAVKHRMIVSAETKEAVEVFYGHLSRVRVKNIADDYFKISE